MRKFFIILVLCSCYSCDLLVSKEEKIQKLVNQEKRAINWNDVDTYPLFENCDESASKTIQRECFETELLKHLAITLQEFEFKVDEGVDKTIFVDFLIDRQGSISGIDIEKDSALETLMPQFNTIISQSLKNLPRLDPALKRGIPVKARFRIPIVLQRN